MKTPNQVLNEQSLNDYSNTVLKESSLSRIFNHFKNREFAILTAFRADNDANENHQANMKLIDDLHKLELGYVPVEGYGQEEDTDGNIHQVKEKSFFVPNGKRIDGKSVGEPIDDFRRHMLDLATKYNQWGITYGLGNGIVHLLQSNGDIYREFDSFVAAVGEFYTKLKGERPFKFESVELYKVKSIFEGMAYNKNGLFILRK